MSAAELEIRFVGDLQRLEVKPGDVFVLKLRDSLSQPALERIYEHWRSIMGDAKLVTIEDGADLGVIGMGDKTC